MHARGRESDNRDNGCPYGIYLSNKSLLLVTNQAETVGRELKGALGLISFAFACGSRGRIGMHHRCRSSDVRRDNFPRFPGGH